MRSFLSPRLAKLIRLDALKDQSGQISIMIGMMMMTFILFFAFVINTGMLVNAKINLQNAADLAAYAGASTQARTLNQISYLNYEMRRQYKKFLFRYYVMGNMAQNPFPRSAGGNGKTPPTWSPDGTRIYGAPTACMIFNSNDNYCQLSELPKITIPASNPLDSINETLIGQLTAIEKIRQQNCVNIGFTNTTVLRLWLWNTDPTLENIQNALPQTLQRSINTIRGLAFGLGLVPRELILRERIRTLNDYINQPAATDVRLETVEGLKRGSGDPAANERMIQAFYSAFYTLGNNVFPAESISMDELTPKTLLTLKDIKAKFAAYALNFSIPSNDKPEDCTPTVEADMLRSPVTLGVSKDRTILTYYAVRLKAKAKIMFSPFGDMDLKAYAAAQPFGSRIGPELGESDFVRQGVDLGLSTSSAMGDLNLLKQVPNLPIREDDSTATGNGWDTREALGAYYQKFQAQGGASGGVLQQIGSDELNRAYQAAMVPNPYEANRYNIMTDNTSDPFVHHFDTEQVAAFWAPIIAPSKSSEADARLQSMVDSLIGDSGPNASDFKAALKQELSTYLGKLRKGQGENIGGSAEGFNIARIQDPFHTSIKEGAQLITLAGGLSETRPEKIKSSWNGVLNGSFRKLGRVGYSVKFVAFDALTKNKLKTDDSQTWNNDLDADGEAAADLELIRH